MANLPPKLAKSLIQANQKGLVYSSCLYLGEAKPHEASRTPSPRLTKSNRCDSIKVLLPVALTPELRRRARVKVIISRLLNNKIRNRLSWKMLWNPVFTGIRAKTIGRRPNIVHTTNQKSSPASLALTSSVWMEITSRPPNQMGLIKLTWTL